MASDEGGLPPGVSNAGAVVLVDGAVRRPRRPNSEAVQRFLRELRATGCSVVPDALGFDSEGRETLSFVPGDVPRRRLQPWAATSESLYEIGVLLQTFRAAAESYKPDPADRWFAQPPIPKAFSGPVVGHNDIDFGNIVFRDGKPAALIDFEYAAPSDIVWEVAVAAFYLVPLRDTEETPTVGGPVRARLGALLEGCGLRASDRARLPEAVVAFHSYRYERARAAGRLTRDWHKRHERDTLWLQQLRQSAHELL